jgi:acetyl esterase/lipase
MCQPQFIRASLVLMLSLCVSPTLLRGDESNLDAKRTMDVVYGRRDGIALTMDVFSPEKPNGAAIIQVISGGYYASHDDIQPALFQPLLKRGYTVFAVVPGSRPVYQVPEIRANLSRAIRYIRYHAKEYSIDPKRLGITGSSAGGNLSLQIATANEQSHSESKDPIDRESSRVQAAAVFFPLTDFLNWSKPGEEHIGTTGHPTPFRAAFDYREMIPETGLEERITDPTRLREITREISPIYALSSDDPPMLLMHGDKDFFVPMYQSKIFMEAAKATGVETNLLIKSGGQHGWPDMQKDMEQFADWFDLHLKAK